MDYGDPKPVYHSYRLLAEKLIGYTSATREVVDDVTTVTIDRSGADRAPVHIVWYLDDHIPAPGESEQTRAFDLQVDTPTLQLTHLITEAGLDTPATEIVETSSGRYSGLATQTPIFVEPLSE